MSDLNTGSAAAEKTPRGMRLHIGIFGRRNAGKSSLLNALTGQDVSIVSETPGTTTDPVEKAMEFPALGPVLFVDTAGIDDDGGTLGEMRIEKTRAAMSRIDLAIVAVRCDLWSEFEDGLLDELRHRKIPAVVAFCQADAFSVDTNRKASILAQGEAAVTVSARSGEGLGDLRQAMIERAPESVFANRPIVSDLIGRGGTAILVTPIDKEAPKGRLILPQVQTIRDLLDGGCISLVVTEQDLPEALKKLSSPPELVVTDSQAFSEVASVLPEEVPLTSFSILFSRLKGDLAVQSEGAAAVETLKPGDKILIAEACTHHPVEEDIGRVKIPRWLAAKVRGELCFDVCQGRDFPEDLSSYSLVVHCGACTFNRRGMLSRIESCRSQGVPISNYGLVIAAAKGILERALKPFPDALEAFLRKRGKSTG